MSGCRGDVRGGVRAGVGDRRVHFPAPAARADRAVSDHPGHVAPERGYMLAVSHRDVAERV